MKGHQKAKKSNYGTKGANRSRSKINPFAEREGTRGAENDRKHVLPRVFPNKPRKGNCKKEKSEPKKKNFVR